MQIDENRCSKCGVGFGDWFETEANGPWHLVRMLNGFIVLSTHQFGFLPCKQQSAAIAEEMALCPDREEQMPSSEMLLSYPMVCYKHDVNLHIWACCQSIFLRSKIRKAPLGERTWERGVPTTHENIWNTLKNSSLKATGFLKTEYPTVGSLEN